MINGRCGQRKCEVISPPLVYAIFCGDFPGKSREVSFEKLF